MGSRSLPFAPPHDMLEDALRGASYPSLLRHVVHLERRKL
jgi:hypothetical protein